MIFLLLVSTAKYINCFVKFIVAKAQPKISTPETTKSRRTWESWSCEDKDTFFEGLYQVEYL